MTESQHDPIVGGVFDDAPVTAPNVTITDRGFKHLDPIRGGYGGETRVYESSAAEHPHIWLAISEPNDLTAWARGDESGGVKDAHNHLSLEAAKALRDQLAWLIENHYQIVHADIVDEPPAEDDPAVRAGLEAVSELIGTARTEPAGMAYIVGSIDAARARANWVPWWLQPVVRTEPSDEYYEGVRDGIRAHAIISDGELLVGALRKPIATVIAEVDAYQAQRLYWRFG